jgi:hypothetical protein
MQGNDNDNWCREATGATQPWRLTICNDLMTIHIELISNLFRFSTSTLLRTLLGLHRSYLAGGDWAPHLLFSLRDKIDLRFLDIILVVGLDRFTWNTVVDRNENHIYILLIHFGDMT